MKKRGARAKKKERRKEGKSNESIEDKEGERKKGYHVHLLSLIDIHHPMNTTLWVSPTLLPPWEQKGGGGTRKDKSRISRISSIFLTG